MPFVSLIRILFILLLAGTGLMNFVWMAQRRGSPAEFRGCLLAGCATLLFAGALAAFSYGQHIAALGTGVGGAVCGLAWFYHIYMQSLHNTTM